MSEPNVSVDSVASVPKDDRPEVAIALGNVSYGLMANGSVIEMPGKRVYAHPEGFEIQKELKLVAVVDGIPLVAGVNVIFGGADASKSPVLRHIAAHTPSTMIRFGEPLPGYVRETDALAKALLSSTTPVICLDSIKNLVGRLAGNAMTSGVSREVFAMLSDWSSFFAERGQAVVTIINVSTDDEKALNMTVEALRTNTNATWRSARNGMIEWQHRTGEGRIRNSGTVQIVWQGDGVVRALRAIGASPEDKRATRKATPVTTTVGSLDTTSTLHRALARVIRETAKQ